MKWELHYTRRTMVEAIMNSTLANCLGYAVIIVAVGFLLKVLSEM